MKTSSAKAKGREGQKEVIRLLESTFPQLKGHFINRSMGSQGEDVILSPEAIKEFPYSVEVKRRKKISILKWVMQAFSKVDHIQRTTESGLSEIREEGAQIYTKPLVFFRKDTPKGKPKEKWYVVVEAEEFLKRFKQ